MTTRLLGDALLPYGFFPNPPQLVLVLDPSLRNRSRLLEPSERGINVCRSPLRNCLFRVPHPPTHFLVLFPRAFYQDFEGRATKDDLAAPLPDFRSLPVSWCLDPASHLLPGKDDPR